MALDFTCTINGVEYLYANDGYSGVTSIIDTSLTELIIPTEAPEGYTVNFIYDTAFYDCSELRVLTLPASIEEFGNNCFSDCSSLEIIYFLGTEAQWNSIIGIETAGIAQNVTIYFKQTAAEKLTLLANEVRELSGTTDLLGLDDMTAAVSAANDEITIQENTITSQNMLIANIVSALEGKAAGGGVDIPTSTVTLEDLRWCMSEVSYTAFEGGNIHTYTVPFTDDPDSDLQPGLGTISNVVRNSIVVLTCTDMGYSVFRINGMSIINSSEALDDNHIILKITDETANIILDMSDIQ